MTTRNLRHWIMLCEAVALMEATENDFMQSGCFIFALWLHSLTGLPLYGLWDHNTTHHAFVYDANNDTAYDARGAHEGLDSVKYYRGSLSKGTEIRPATVADVREHAKIAAEFAAISGRPVPTPRAIPSFVSKIPSLARLAQFTLTKNNELNDSIFAVAAKLVIKDIDWSGGNGETVYDIIKHEFYNENLPDDYNEGGNSRLFNRLLKIWAMETVKSEFIDLKRMFKGDTITIWREITQKPDWKLTTHPGLYWSWDKNAAEAHWGQFKNGHVKWLITAEVKFSEINWPATLAANTNPDSKSEKEITLKRNSNVKIINIERI